MEINLYLKSGRLVTKTMIFTTDDLVLWDGSGASRYFINANETRDGLPAFYETFPVFAFEGEIVKDA